MDYLKTLTLVTLIVILVSLAIVVITVLTMVDLSSVLITDICLQRKNGNLDCKPSMSVLPGYLSMSISEEHQRIRTREQAKMDKYFNDEENREHIEAIYSNDYWEMKPVGRVTGERIDKPLKQTIKKGMEPVLNWKHSGTRLSERNGYLQAGVRYYKGRLVVPTSGSYFVYSFIDFYENCKPETGEPDIEDINNQLIHGIYRFNILDGQETEVVSGHHPHKLSLNRNFNTYSSYIKSLIHLAAGDEISVKVSNISSIRYSEENYFGLFLV